jgi:hypothetical protein
MASTLRSVNSERDKRVPGAIREVKGEPVSQQTQWPAAILQRMGADQTALSPQNVKILQSTIGNQAVLRLMRAQVRSQSGAARAQRRAAERVDEGPQTSDGSFEAGADVSQQLSARKGTGSPLPTRVRGYMEKRFGADFSNVRIQASREAADLNRQVNAQAFTYGQDIYMGAGKYRPETKDGQKLLAHELTHVVQQTGDSVQRKAQRKPIAVSHAPAPTVQRLITRANWIKLAGDVSGTGKRHNSLYAQLLNALDEYHSKATAAEQKVPLKKVVQLSRSWIDKHTKGVLEAGVQTGVGQADSELIEKKDARKEMFMYGLKAEAEAEFKGQPLPDSAPSHYIGKWTKSATKGRELEAALQAGINAAKYQFSILAAVENKDYLEFAKKRIDLTVSNKAKGFFGRGKSNAAIKQQAAEEAIHEKYQASGMTLVEMQEKINTLLNAGSQVGHAWVKLRALNADNTPVKENSFGFWPLKGFLSPTVSVAGRIRSPDTLHEDDPSVRRQDFPIQMDKYKAALAKAASLMKSPPEYKLIDYNCTKFARDIALAAGVSFPERAYVRIPLHGMAWDPNSLFREMKTNPQSYNPNKAANAARRADEQRQQQEAQQRQARMTELRDVMLTLHRDPMNSNRAFQIDAWDALSYRQTNPGYLADQGPFMMGSPGEVEVKYSGERGEILTAVKTELQAFMQKVEEAFNSGIRTT